jgi:hypothetical protein
MYGTDSCVHARKYPHIIGKTAAASGHMHISTNAFLAQDLLSKAMRSSRSLTAHTRLKPPRVRLTQRRRSGGLLRSHQTARSSHTEGAAATSQTETEPSTEPSTDCRCGLGRRFLSVWRRAQLVVHELCRNGVSRQAACVLSVVRTWCTPQGRCECLCVHACMCVSMYVCSVKYVCMNVVYIYIYIYINERSSVYCTNTHTCIHSPTNTRRC